MDIDVDVIIMDIDVDGLNASPKKLWTQNYPLDKPTQLGKYY